MRTTREIELTQNKFAIVDDEDYNNLSCYSWCAMKVGNTFYAVRAECKKTILMHRVILSRELEYTNFEVDHLDHDGLNNQKRNLLVVTHRQNLQNNRKGTFPGVCWDKNNKKWKAHISINNVLVYLGYYQTEYGAYLAYLSALEANGLSLHPKVLK